MCHFTDTFSLIFIVILHFKDELIEVQRRLLTCPSHRANNWQNHNSNPNLSAFNDLAFSTAALLTLLPCWSIKMSISICYQRGIPTSKFMTY